MPRTCSKKLFYAYNIFNDSFSVQTSLHRFRAVALLYPMNVQIGVD